MPKIEQELLCPKCSTFFQTTNELRQHLHDFHHWMIVSMYPHAFSPWCELCCGAGAMNLPETRSQESQTAEEYLVRVRRPVVQFRMMVQVIFFEHDDEQELTELETLPEIDQVEKENFEDYNETRDAVRCQVPLAESEDTFIFKDAS